MVASDRISIVRLRPRHDDPRQGRDPDPDVAVVVRPARATWCHNHVVSTDVPDAVRGRAVVCERLDDVPRRVRRARLPHRLRPARVPTQSGEVCGIALPGRARWTAAGCRGRSSRRPPRPRSATTTRTSPSTPSSPPRSARSAAERLRDLTLTVYARAEDLARERGIILADTKFEFGRPAADGTDRARRRGAHPRLLAASGRLDRVGAGRTAAVLRQARRARLADLAGVRLGPHARARPRRRCRPEVVERTRSRYVEAYELLTGQSF